MPSVKLPRLASRMTARDAGFLYMERTHASLHIGCVAIVEGALSVADLVGRVEMRLPRMPRYAQRAVPAPLGLGHPSWEDECDLDVRDHVTRWSLPTPGGEAELRELVATLLAQPLARERPLWEMHLIDGLDGGRTALFQKVHHCMVDGVAGAQLLETLLDATPRALDVTPPRVGVPPPPDLATRMGSALVDTAKSQIGFAGSLLGALRGPGQARDALRKLRDAAFSALQIASRDLPAMPWNAPLGPRRRLAFAKLPMEGVRRIRAARGGTVNDVVLCTLAGGLHRHLRHMGVSTRGLELTALVPVSLRPAEEARAQGGPPTRSEPKANAAPLMGNRISAMLVPLAVDPDHEVPRLVSTRAITERLKESAAWTGIDSLLATLEALPPGLVALAGQGLSLGGLANVVATNVPGPRETRWLCRHKVEALYPIVPIVDGIGLGLAVFSYDGWLHIGLNADAGLLPDLEKLERGILEAFAELLASV